MTLYRALESQTTPTAGSIDSAVTLGLEISVTTTCYLREIRWVQPVTNSNLSDRTVGIYSTTDGVTGSLILSGTSTPTAAGWVTYDVGTPVTLTPGHYRAAVFHPSGGYSATANFFDSTGVWGTFGPFQVYNRPDALNATQGSYNTAGSLTFPDQQFNAANYWVDVTIDDTAPAAPSVIWSYSIKVG